MSWREAQFGLFALLGLLWLGGAAFTDRTVRRESLGSRLAYAVVVAAGCFLVVTLQPDARVLPDGPVDGAVGVALTAVGVAIAAWARVTLGRLWSGTITLKEGHRLIRTGPYAFVRHPIYTGFLVGMLGFAVTTGTIRGFVGFVLVVAGFAWKASKEERLLARQFGEEHAAYRREVRMLVPWRV